MLCNNLQHAEDLAKMSDIIPWLQLNWMEAIMLVATLAAVASSVLALRIAILALGVAKESASSAIGAHERDVRLQARSALADLRGSFQKLATDCDLNQEIWRQHELSKGITFSRHPFEPTEREKEALNLRKQGENILKSLLIKFGEVDQMTIFDLESAIPEMRQATSSIDALGRRLQQPEISYR